MARTTNQLRALWYPPCKGPWARVKLNGEGYVNVRPAIVDAVRALDTVFVRWGYRTRLGDTGAYNCRKITNGDDWSLHAYATAIDANWQTNPYGPVLITDMPIEMIVAIERIRTRSGAPVWRWGGRFAGNKDAMHFEVVASPAEIASGIDPLSLYPEVHVSAPELHIDQMQDDGNGRIFVSGWAYDPDTPLVSIVVPFHVWDAGEGPEITHLTADQPSPDVNVAKGIGGFHRFAGTLPLPAVKRRPTVITWAMDDTGVAVKKDERIVDVRG